MCHSLRRAPRILSQEGTDMTACRRISQMEVHQLPVSGLQVAYPVGLNGHEDPIITSLTESLANGISLTGGGSVYLEINILQPMVEELDRKELPLGRCSAVIIAIPLKTTPPKLEREVSMTVEVRSLLSQAMLDMSGHGSGNSTPKRPNPVVILTPPTHKLKDLPQTGGHLILDECARWHQDGRSLIRRSPHHHLSHSCNSKVQEHHASCRCGPTLREGQQSPGGAAGL